MHTENIASIDLIRAAVVAQLAKPAVEPTAWGLLTKGFKYEVLTWVGIVGGALTLFTNLGAVLKLADWARLLVQHWRDWTHAFWLWAFGWLGIHLAPEWTPVLSFLLFGSLLAIGQAFQFTRSNKTDGNKYLEKSFQLISRRTLVCFVSILAAILLAFALLVLEDLKVLPDPIGAIGFVLLFFAPQAIIVLFARHRAYTTLSLCLTLIFFCIIAFYPLFSMHWNDPYNYDPGVEARQVVPYTSMQIMWVLPLILLSVAPAKDISCRLIFLAIGLLLLIGLNELSKLGIDLTAPKLQG